MSDLSRVEAEVAEWPGVSIARRELGGKHGRIVLAFNGRERFITCAVTSSDWRVDRNRIRDLRKTLRELGATRKERRKATLRRQRNRPERNPLTKVELAPVKANPFEALAAVEFAKATPTQSAKTTQIGLVRRVVARCLKGICTIANWRTESGDAHA